MSEMRNSHLLTLLIEEAKRVGKQENPPLTAERLLVAIIDRINSEAEEHVTLELAAIQAKVGRFFPDQEKAREYLLDYIQQNAAYSFLDDLYMKGRLQAAQQEAALEEDDELDAVRLVACILAKPSAAIMSARDIVEMEEKVDQQMQDIFAELDALDRYDEDDEAEEAEEKTVPPPDEKAVYHNAKQEITKLVAEVKAIRQQLKDVIFGQDHAIEVFATGYFQASMLSALDQKRKRPKATFLFAGPPGVGKTFLAEQVAQVLGRPFQRFDMSEYSDKEANLEFCGSDKVYKGAKAGNVTSFVAEHPDCVLLFDEIEKAHLNVIHLFLQLLDAGRLRDNYTDQEVSFRDTVIIFTTNAGRQLYEQMEGGDMSGVSRKVVLKALQKDINPITNAPYFPAAMCSRFASGNVVMFNHMGANHLSTIAAKEIRHLADNLTRQTDIRLDIDPQVYTALLFAEGAAADARTIRSRAESFFNGELYELLRLVATDKVRTGISELKQIRIFLDLSRAPQEISGLFDMAQKPWVLTFADRQTVELCEKKAPQMAFVGVQSVEEAVEVMKTTDVNFVLMDIKCGTSGQAFASLNIEDVESEGRNFFKFLRQRQPELPVYLVETSQTALTEEEKVSFLRQGVRGVLAVDGEAAEFAGRLEAVAEALYQQASMAKLAKENKQVSFETAQTVSDDGHSAAIRLFDFQMGVAVDAEDAKNVLSAVSKPNVHFEDVIGARDAKQELTYFVEYLKNPKKYMGTGVKAPRGVLLYGPPGTGKTMLAKAMACEAGVTFIAAEGNQFLKKYVGEGSEKVHELFRTARKYAPSVLFIDEIDAIAKERRGANQMGGDEATLTAFLTEMDGFTSDPSRPVFVLAATNFEVEPGGPRSLDPALMRRFDRRVYIDLPNKADRIFFLNEKVKKNVALQVSQTQIEDLAIRSTGMSLAELDSIVELALRSAIRTGSAVVTDAVLEEAFETFNSGEVKKWNVDQLERVARHEAGHALICWLGGEKPTYLTIVARGNHGGYMQRETQEGKAIYTRQELLARIRTSLGGRAAELVYYGPDGGVSTGAGGDLVSATELARRLVCSYGMDESFGLAVVSGGEADGPMSLEVRSAVNRILAEQMEQAVGLIRENQGKIDALVEQLLAKNHLNGLQIQQTLAKTDTPGQG